MSFVILAILVIHFTATIFNPSGISVDAVPSRAVFNVRDEIFQTQKVPFIRNEAYLSMNIPYNPVKELFDDVQKSNLHVPGRNLLNRDEAHITVITPPEYKRLQKFISMSEINNIADTKKIQSTPFTINCLGRSLAFISGPSEPAAETVYLIVDAPALKTIREKVWQEFVKRGGKPDDFKWDQYWPHVTVGFNPRDLHLADGAIKDERSCAARIEVIKS